MEIGGKCLFRTRQVESHHPQVAGLHGQPGDYLGVVALPHGVEDQTPTESRLGAAPTQPGRHRLHRPAPGESLLGEKAGGKPYLGVDHPIGGEVEGRLIGHPHQGILCLHQTHGVHEGLQVPLQGTRPALLEPVGQRFGIRCRQTLIAGLGRQLHQGGSSWAAVEMVVEQHRRQGHARTVASWDTGKPRVR